jgi:NDP-sugar pyrophosphorylase family protein
MNPTLVVMAAGMASRYGGLKQVEAVGPAGETIIDYSIFDARRAGFGKVVFVIRREIEDVFKRTIGDRFASRIDVAYAFQETGGRAKPWGTGQAVLVASPLVTGPFAVINGDDFYGAHAFQVIADHLRRNTGEHAIVGYPLRLTLSGHGAVSRAICDFDEQRLLRGLREVKQIDHSALDTIGANTIVSMNMMGFFPNVFEQMQPMFEKFRIEHASDETAEFLLPSAVSTLINRHLARVRVLETSARWFGMTYQEDTAAVRQGIAELVARGEYPLPCID